MSGCTSFISSFLAFFLFLDAAVVALTYDIDHHVDVVKQVIYYLEQFTSLNSIITAVL